MSVLSLRPDRLRQAVLGLFKDANRTSFELFRIMVPVMVVVKLLQELELIGYLALPLGPVMELLGLPAQTGLVWATALVMNIYSAIVVYAALLPDMQVLSVAQITVLSVVILIAHNLPVELRIAQRCGLSLMVQLLIRVLGALVCGLLLHWLFTASGLLQDPAVMRFVPEQSDPALSAWALAQLRTLAAIYCIVLVLMGFMRALQQLRILELMNKLLRPALKLMGIGKQAASITVVGLTLGIAYGGGLIIHEVRSGAVPHKDVFGSMSLMGLAHALIEDTLLMSLLGAHSVGTFWFRLLFSLLAVALITRLHTRLHLRRALQAQEAAVP